MLLQIDREITVKKCFEESSKYLGKLDCVVLLAFAVKKEKEFVLSHPEYTLSRREFETWKNAIKRRLEGEPIAYITGYREFYSLCFYVNHSTLIPRPETEHLVDQILSRRPSSLLDLGTGCGNIAVTVKYSLPDCDVYATDISGEALKVAGENARRILGQTEKIAFYQGDFFDPLPEYLKFDIIASNPPYVRSIDIEKLPREVRDFEPLYALDGGEDGLDAYRKILGNASKRLNKNGVIIFEVDESILEGFINLCYEMSYECQEVINDYSGRPRVAILAEKVF